MVSNLVLAKLCQDAYVEPWTWGTKDVHATLRLVDGLSVVTFMGSKNLIDWWRDIQVFGNDTFTHPEFGLTHNGFYDDVTEIFDQIEATVGDVPVWYNGHSKGGAEAQIAAARRIIAGKPVAGISTFGAPRVGLLGGLIAKCQGTDLQNYRDPVPELPPGLPHPRLTTIVGGLNMKNIFNPISDHFIARYIEVVDRG